MKVRLLSLSSLLLVLQLHPLGLNAAEFDPKFSMPIQNVSVVAGREARIVCGVENLQNYKVAWVHYGERGSAVLTVGTHVLTTNRRISVESGRSTWTLVISNTTIADRGDYMCQISTVPPKKTYGRLQVRVPPLITLPPNDVTVDEGQNATLECQATGDPKPTIIWRREGGGGDAATTQDANWLYEDDQLVLSAVDRGDAGAYLCVASNGVPPAVSARAEVFVNYEPIIAEDGEVAWAQDGQEAELTCHFEGYPLPTAKWKKIEQDSGEEIKELFKIESLTRASSRIMFRPVEKEDFGSYQCIIGNKLGSTSMTRYLMEMTTTTTTTTTTPTTTSTTTTAAATSTSGRSNKDDVENLKSNGFTNSSGFALSDHLHELQTGGGKYHTPNDKWDGSPNDNFNKGSNFQNLLNKDKDETEKEKSMKPPNKYIQEAPQNNDILENSSEIRHPSSLHLFACLYAALIFFS